MIVEFEGNLQSVFTITTGNFFCSIKAEELIRKAKVFPLYEESKARIKKSFNFGEKDVKNHDVFYANCGKILVGQLCPAASFTKKITFDNLPRFDGENYYYIRASQIDGQYVWSSAVWVS